MGLPPWLDRPVPGELTLAPPWTQLSAVFVCVGRGREAGRRALESFLKPGCLWADGLLSLQPPCH